ncbi:type II toxin-antitoxin system RelE/ParE family toxin [Hyphomonas sp.]|uniref:type II toxin-antitoxin system RelE/ParE family toxin n=1 Tax=Hyphomonas sp. TaxID=87 RepID=UPI00391D1CD8
MTTLRITEDALRDLSDIRAYTRREFGVRQASLYLGRLKEGFKALRKHPEIGFPIDHLKAGFRCFRVEHHAIFYVQRDEVIAVVAILHESQLPTRHLDQRSGA